MSTGELINDASSCEMCKRLIINAGIDKMVIRNTPDKYTVVEIESWVDNDDTLSGKTGY